MAIASSLKTRCHHVLARWQGLNPRERNLLTLALLAILGMFVWTLLISPALKTAKGASEQASRLAAQVAQVQRMQLKADDLRSLPRLQRQETAQILQTLTAELNSGAQVHNRGDMITVTVQGLAASELEQWLEALRVQAHTGPSELRLRQSDSPESSDARWTGEIRFLLPP